MYKVQNLCHRYISNTPKNPQTNPTIKNHLNSSPSTHYPQITPQIHEKSISQKIPTPIFSTNDEKTYICKAHINAFTHMIQTLPPPPTMEIETKTQKASIDHLPTILTRHDICEQFKIPVSNNWYYLNKHVLTNEVIKEIGYTRRQLQHIRTFSKLNSHHRPMFYWLAKQLKEWI